MSMPEIGDRVVLAANEDESWEREHATVLDVQPNGTITVEVDKDERDGPQDDGLREITVDQIEDVDLELRDARNNHGQGIRS